MGRKCARSWYSDTVTFEVVVEDFTTTVKFSAASEADKTLEPGKYLLSVIVNESVPVLSDVVEKNILY